MAREVADHVKGDGAAPRPPRRAFAWIGPLTSRLRAVLRVLTYAMVVCAGIAFFALRSAYGDIQESVLILGRELSQFDDLLGESTRVRLNGEVVYVASAMTDQPVGRVLDRFERICRKGNGLAREFEKLPEHLKAEVRGDLGEEPDEDGSGLGVMRGQTEVDGMVACLVDPPGQKGKDTVERLTEFAETGDLAKVGWLRYAYARRTEKGRTHVITSWTDGAFRVFALIPDEGQDAPGSDPDRATRPGAAKRILSAEIEGAPHSIRIYDSRRPVEEVLASYDTEMPKLGWRKLPFVEEEVEAGRAYARDGVETLVFVYENPGGSLISMVQTSGD